MDILKRIKNKNSVQEINDKNTLQKESYWEDVYEIPLADSEQLDLLTEEARQFVDIEKKEVIKEFSKRAPWDIYPVY
jgi:hypothetical protein